MRLESDYDTVQEGAGSAIDGAITNKDSTLLDELWIEPNAVYPNEKYSRVGGQSKNNFPAVICLSENLLRAVGVTGGGVFNPDRHVGERLICLTRS